VVESYLLAGTYENAIMVQYSPSPGDPIVTQHQSFLYPSHQVFDLSSLQRIKELAGHCGAVYAVCTQDGKRVFSGSYDSTIKVSDTRNLELRDFKHCFVGMESGELPLHSNLETAYQQCRGTLPAFSCSLFLFWV